MVNFVNQSLAILTIGSQILVLTIIISTLVSKSVKKDVLNFLKKHYLKLSFFVALLATLGSLFYSDIAHFNPCKLCWYQRIFMYPLVLLFGLAIYRKDNKVTEYGLIMSVIGFLIAGYHYLMQLGFVPALSCAAVGYSASCAKEFVMQFGYITIPMMSLTAFGLIILLLGITKFKK